MAPPPPSAYASDIVSAWALLSVHDVATVIHKILTANSTEAGSAGVASPYVSNGTWTTSADPRLKGIWP